jgi:hypothetical protein
MHRWLNSSLTLGTKGIDPVRDGERAQPVFQPAAELQSYLQGQQNGFSPAPAEGGSERVFYLLVGHDYLE